MGEMRIVLDCKLDTIHEVLKQAQQVNKSLLPYSLCTRYSFLGFNFFSP